MITEKVLSIFVGLVRSVLSAVPTPPLPPLDALQNFAGLLARGGRLFNAYFPIGLLGACLAVLIVAQLSLFTYNLVRSVVHLFWGGR
jgi:hypothetical protein